MNLTHASFFSGVGGLDLGLERAGWRTVSFSEIDPYASAVLAHRWPGVPKLGDIVRLDRGDADDGGRPADAPGGDRAGHSIGPGRAAWTRAFLWTGGFPCQDLSVAGKRRGMGTHGDRADTRSGLAYAFLDLVERHRPPAVLLENVPGLLSSHRGRDFYALQRRLAELGYVGAYRVLDARHFGVPQRRRRVFILALDARRGATADDAAEVLAVGTRCGRHPAAGGEAGPNAADGLGAGISRSLSTSQERIDADTESFVVRPSPDPGGVRAADGLARRLDDRAGVVNALDQRRGGADDNEAQAGHLVVANAVSASAGHHGHSSPRGDGGDNLVPIYDVDGSVAFCLDDPLLPPGLDSHRYRCCGNGVVAPVAEWIGHRLAAWAQSVERVA